MFILFNFGNHFPHLKNLKCKPSDINKKNSVRAGSKRADLKFSKVEKLRKSFFVDFLKEGKGNIAFENY